MEDRRIPNPVIAVVADVLGGHYFNHTRLNTLFAEAGAPGDPPEGNCVQKCDRWLRRCNEDPDVDALAVLGRTLEVFMEVDHPPKPWEPSEPDEHPGKKRIRDMLARHGLSYQPGGVVLGRGSSPASKPLRELLHAKDLAAVEKEFQRALGTVEADPPAGVTAACALLESLFKVYIEDNHLDMPTKQTIGDLYRVVRDHLGFDPAQVSEQDLKRILSGLISIIDGIGALRTHSGSAHGQGRRSYRLGSRHARLAINAAHTVALFILETWSRQARGAV
jgi:hypothetical protein